MDKGSSEDSILSERTRKSLSENAATLKSEISDDEMNDSHTLSSQMTSTGDESFDVNEQPSKQINSSSSSYEDEVLIDGESSVKGFDKDFCGKLTQEPGCISPEFSTIEKSDADETKVLAYHPLPPTSADSIYTESSSPRMRDVTSVKRSSCAETFVDGGISVENPENNIAIHSVSLNPEILDNEDLIVGESKPSIDQVCTQGNSQFSHYEGIKAEEEKNFKCDTSFSHEITSQKPVVPVATAARIPVSSETFISVLPASPKTVILGSPLDYKKEYPVTKTLVSPEASTSASSANRPLASRRSLPVSKNCCKRTVIKSKLKGKKTKKNVKKGRQGTKTSKSHSDRTSMTSTRISNSVISVTTSKFISVRTSNCSVALSSRTRYNHATSNCQEISLRNKRNQSFAYMQGLNFSNNSNMSFLNCQDLSLSKCGNLSFSNCQNVCLKNCSNASLVNCQGVSLSECKNCSYFNCQNLSFSK